MNGILNVMDSTNLSLPSTQQFSAFCSPYVHFTVTKSVTLSVIRCSSLDSL